MGIDPNQIRNRNTVIRPPPDSPPRAPTRTESSASGGGGHRWAVLRRLQNDEGQPALMAHLLRNLNTPPTDGDWEAHGDELQMFPMPGSTVDLHDIPGAVRPLVGELEDEVLGVGFIPWKLYSDRTCEIALKLAPGVTFVDPNAETGGAASA